MPMLAVDHMPMLAVDPSFQMWATFALITIAMVLFALERLPMELTSIGLVCALMLLFHFFPVEPVGSGHPLDAARLLQGFGNPALITIVALLVIGEGLVRTGVLDRAAQTILEHSGTLRIWLVPFVLFTVLAVSGFLNNIPVVVIFIPIMQVLSERLGQAPSRLMMPLSFAAMLGGMTTLIGSSTNLLVSGTLVEIGEHALSFFSFTVPGLVLAVTGFFYLVLVVPRLLPKHTSPMNSVSEGAGRQFIAQIVVKKNSDLIGREAVFGLFPSITLRDMTVRSVLSHHRTILPPFEEYTVAAGDVFTVAATRRTLADVLAHDPGLFQANPDEDPSRPAEENDQQLGNEQLLAEVLVAPGSRFIGRTLDNLAFERRFGCVVLGVQRHSRMIRSRLSAIRLDAGDVLLIQGQPKDVRALRANPDIILLEWATTDLPKPYYARRATFIFLAVVLAAATGVLPIVVAALCGAVTMFACRALNLRHLVDAIDGRIILMIATALALGAALTETGGAQFLADALLDTLEGASPAAILSAFFLLVALLSNVLSTKACAVLFTPIAVDIGHGLGVDPMAFAVAVIFAANCSFASPIGYQTNLLVIAPGNYRFLDFARVGLPMIILLWLAFSFFAPWYYGLF